MKLLPKRWEALEDRRLNSVSRRFLYGLTCDERGIACHGSSVAGINAVYELRRK